LLGIRYVVAKSPYAHRPTYRKVDSVGGVDVLENAGAPAIGFLADAGVLAGLPHTEGENPFTLQNAMWAAVAGRESADILTPVALGEPALENLRGEEENGVTHYVRMAEDQPAALVYSLRAPGPGTLYLYHSADAPTQEADLFVNGERKAYGLDPWGYGTIALGAFAPGEEVEIRLFPWAERLTIGRLICGEENAALLAELSEAVRAQPVKWTRMGGEVMKGLAAVSKPNQVLLITVPMAEGWRARVDGQPAEIRRGFGWLMALPLDPGEHAIELVFTPPGLWLGAAISMISLCAAVLWAATRQRAKKKRMVKM
jgi:hypothetical protein